MPGVAGGDAVARASLARLDVERKAIESEMHGHIQYLESTPLGVDAPLVDAEGFPRSDVDLNKVAHARQELIKLKNDLKDKRAEIEAGLHALHAVQQPSAGSSNPEPSNQPERQNQNSGSSSTSNAQAAALHPSAAAQAEAAAAAQATEPDVSSPAFMTIGDVSPRSPADTGGLREGDHVHKVNDLVQPDGMRPLLELVGAHENKVLLFHVTRSGSAMVKAVVPRAWQGRGILGCQILPK